MSEAPRLVVAVGSNIDAARNLPAALGKLRERVEIEALSAVYRTPPVNAPGTPDYCNAALLVRSELPPARLKLEVLRPIEAELGRVRGSDPNAPRPIDLDLVLWSEGELDDLEAGLDLPDPELAVSAHLAIPAAEVAPDWLHTPTGRTLAELAAGFPDRPPRVELEGWTAGGQGEV